MSKQKPTKPKVTQHFDLRKTRLDDIHEVSLDLGTGTMSVQVALAVGGDHQDSFATYQEVIDLDDEELEPYLTHALKAFLRAGQRYIVERAGARVIPCETCIGACCGMAFDTIALYPEDISVLQSIDPDWQSKVTLYDSEKYDGSTGRITLLEPEDDEPDDEDEDAPDVDDVWLGAHRTRCPYLAPNGCSIYEKRPRVCREFSAMDCDVHEEDQAKVDGKVHLRVVGGA